MRTGVLALLGAVTLTGLAVAAVPQRPDGAPATCRRQSSFDFKRSASDLVIGPLILAGARRYTPPEIIAKLGGNKYPAIVRAGHRVTVELPRTRPRSASLLYADDRWSLPDGKRSIADGHRVVEFRSCTAARAGSSYDGRKATFWSGFVFTTAPACLKLRIWIDDERTPRQARISLGRPCA